MPSHRVKQGECLTSIAARYGFADWRAIYQHPNNAELRKKRPNPSLLFPGDALFIPEKRRKTVAAQTGKELMDDGLPSGVNEPRHPAPRHIRLMRSEIGLLRNQ